MPRMPWPPPYDDIFFLADYAAADFVIPLPDALPFFFAAVAADVARHAGAYMPSSLFTLMLRH